MALPVYAFNETNRMATTQTHLLRESVGQGQLIYAQNCVVCHGANGQGIGTYPGLDSEGVRTMDYDPLFKTIERGRYGTAMAAWGVKEGGVLNNQQIEQVIAMLQNGDWTATARTVDAAGLNPPTVLKVDIPAEALASLSSLPHGQVLAEALPIYAANCTGCHGPQGEGTAIAPALNDPTLRSQRSDDELTRTITNGVPNTLMAGWRQALTPDKITNLVNASPAADSVPPLFALEARLVLHSIRSERCLSVHQFATGPDRTLLTTDELLIKIVLSKLQDEGQRIMFFEKVGGAGWLAP